MDSCCDTLFQIHISTLLGQLRLSNQRLTGGSITDSIIMVSQQVVCTGMGMVSPLGLGVRKSWSALLRSNSGIVNLRNEHSFEGSRSKIAAYVPDEDVKDQLAMPKHSYMVKNMKQLSRPTIFAMLAAHEALEDAQLLDDSGQLIDKYRKRCGVAIGQGMVDFQDIYDNGSLILDGTKEKSGYRKMSPFFMTRALINMSAGNISIRYKANGPNHCVSTACATGAHSIGDALNFIRNGQADIMICGSTEASINSIAMAGFERLRALCTKYNDNPEAASRPFDQARCGFVMGEGAGVLILENYEHALQRGLKDDKLYCSIMGYGTSSDGYHLTAPSPDGLGAVLSMRSALKDAKIKPSTVTHVNAHSTSTPIGDEIELSAIEELFCPTGDQQSSHNRLSVTSCKGSIGHLLGGAGSVESIFAVLSCHESKIPHCLNLDNPISTSKKLIEIVQNEPRKWDSKVRILVKNSFGFGGTNASLVMSSLI